MSALIDSCSPCCTATPAPVNVIGSPGLAGAAGTNGINAFTTLTAVAGVTIPAIGSDVTAAVAENSWMSIGQQVFLSDGTDKGTFTVKSKTGTTSVVLTFLGAPGDSAPAAVINQNGTVSPGGAPGALAAALPGAETYAALTAVGAVDNLAAIAVGVGYSRIHFRHQFIGGTSAVEPVTNLTLGYKFRIVSWDWITTVLLVGAGGSRVANMTINGVAVGTVMSTVTVAIASAAVGTVIAGTAVAGANTGDATATLSIQIANGGTAFTAGSGLFSILVQNMDTADAIANICKHINDLIAAL